MITAVGKNVCLVESKTGDPLNSIADVIELLGTASVRELTVVLTVA
jgi:hypothetical protein